MDFIVCQKERYGDRNVSISMPDIKNTGNTPIIVDDIISTGESLLATLHQVLSRGFKNPICIGVHALFDKNVENNLLLAGAKKIITCNTITHPTNQIDITEMIAKNIIDLC